MTITRRGLFGSVVAALALRKVAIAAPSAPGVTLSSTSDHVIVPASEYGRTFEISAELMEAARGMGRTTRDNADARALEILQDMRRDWARGRT